MAFFAISGLDILNALDVLDAKRKERIVDWIYRLQVVPDGSRKKNWYMLEKYSVFLSMYCNEAKMYGSVMFCCKVLNIYCSWDDHWDCEFMFSLSLVRQLPFFFFL